MDISGKGGAIMMEEETFRRRLKRLSSLPCESKEQSPESNSLDSKRSPTGTETPESSGSEIEIQEIKGRKAKPAKNKAPKMPKFNKLIDVKTTLDEYVVTEFEYLRDEPLEISNNKKEKKMSFFSKVKSKQEDKTSYSLAKSVLTNKDERDSLVVNAPMTIEGFISKAQTSNPREMFRDNLKNVINERKTLHIGKDNIFDKSSSDLTKKEEIIEKNETSFHSDTQSKLHSFEKISKIQETSRSNTSEILEKSDPVTLPKELTPIKKISVNARNRPKTVRIMPTEADQAEDKRLKSYPSTSASSPVYMPREQVDTRSLMEHEAEESSANSYECSVDSKEEEENDRNLEELIDDHKIEENREACYSKHVKDMLEKEEKELFMVANADFKRKNTEELWENKKKMKIQAAASEKPKAASRTSVFSKADEDSDEETRFKLLRESMNIKNVRRNQESALIIDERSNDFLKLIEKPEITRSHKTMLNTECAKSSSTLSTSDSSGAHSYFKMKKTDTPEEISAKAPIRKRTNFLSLLKK